MQLSRVCESECGFFNRGKELAMDLALNFLVSGALDIVASEAVAEVLEAAGQEDILEKVSTQLKKQEEALNALREKDLYTAMQYFRLAVTEEDANESKEDYKKAEEYAMKAFTVVPDPMQKVEATKIAIASAYFSRVRCDPSSETARQGLQRASQHLTRLLDEKKMKKVMRPRTDTWVEYMTTSRKHKERAASVGAIIKGFLELPRMGVTEEFVRIPDDQRSLAHILAEMAFDKEAEMKGHSGPVECLATVKGWLFSGSQDHSVRVWSMATWDCEATLENHTAGVRSLVATDDWLFSGCDDGSILVWRIGSWEKETALSGHKACVASMVAVEDSLISGSADATVRVWKTGRGWWKRHPQVIKSHQECVTAVSASQKYLFSASEDRTARVWRISAMTMPGYWKCCQTLKGHDGHVTALAATRELLFTGSSDKAIRVWKMCEKRIMSNTWECVKVLKDSAGSVTSLAVHEHYLISAFDDNSIMVWTIGTWECCRVREKQHRRVGALLVLGDRVVSGSDDKRVRVWKATP
ncbi:unnamed protein product [Ostreobium quekettii]|uniref:Uncharacterized protein n=1 Tax=Ostreobium quekettii TaxID=121088 RepID=A0A8S1J628_9CHLO|nr:unnamed protein product [Ostreobium quekettii]